MNENVIGPVINVRETLRPHNSEPGWGSIGRVTVYLGCQIGETYIAFNDIKNPHLGTIAKIKRDLYGGSGCIAPFGKNDNDKNNENISYDSNAIVYFANYKYIMRIS